MSRACLVFLIFISALYSASAQAVFQRSFIKMGSAFDLTLVANNQVEADQLFKQAIAEIDRIERLISSWDQSSETSQVNQMAGKEAVKVAKELYDLVFRAKAIAQLTNGAFDPTYASVDKIWTFDGRDVEQPKAEIISASVAKIGFDKIVFDPLESSLYLPLQGMKIGFGAIGKGYAADRVKSLLQNQGVAAGIVNASGDMSAWGIQPNGEPWQVGLINPKNKDKVFAWFPVKNQAVVTSGDYEKFILINGKRYGHIINPKTGFPSQGVISCTVFAPKAELADALSTALFVMGVETGIDFINQLNQVEAIMIDDTGKVHISKNIKFDETT
jgi:thiamine biosynthesis lipoprotein